MSMPERLRLSRLKGSKLPPNACSVARPSRFSNPFRIGDELKFPYKDTALGPGPVRDRAHAVELFRALVEITPFYGDWVRMHLTGRDLACWCPLPEPGQPDVCHAAVLLELANTPDGAS